MGEWKRGSGEHSSKTRLGEEYDESNFTQVFEVLQEVQEQVSSKELKPWVSREKLVRSYKEIIHQVSISLWMDNSQ